MHKSAHLHHLCQTSAKYRSHWDAKAGLPPLVQQIKNVSKATLKWVAAGRPARTKDERQDILAICQRCEHHKPKENGIGRCKLCGCVLREKVKMATESCPDGRW